jgi:hypothetical protein
MRRVVGAIAAAVLAGALLMGTIAVAETAPSRSEYVSQLEAICKPRALATERATKGARADISAERLEVAAGKFGRATTIFGSTVDLISPVPRPPADASRLKEWFSYLSRQETYLEEITTQLRARHTIKAQRLIAHFIHSGNLANNVVLPFGFNYCSFKFSRFD